ncbi:hypothetical protein SCANM63S_03198 [Streptomyces canarius]
MASDESPATGNDDVDLLAHGQLLCPCHRIQPGAIKQCTFVTIYGKWHADRPPRVTR